MQRYSNRPSDFLQKTLIPNRPSVFHEPIQEDDVLSVSPFDIIEIQYPEETRQDSSDASAGEYCEALNMRDCEFIISFKICIQSI